MEQKATTKEVNQSQEIASCRKSICEIIKMLEEKVQELTVLFHKLTTAERNLIGEELTEILEKSMRVILDTSRTFKIQIERPAARTLFLE
jgi:hypothetical protein